MNTEEEISKAATLRKKLDALKAQVRAIEAKERREVKDQARKARQRRIFMIGEIFVVGAESEPEIAKLITGIIDTTYDGAADRALWGLPPRTPTPAEQTTP